MKQQRTSREGNLEVTKADIGSILASISVSEANVNQPAETLKLLKLD
jgi:membrane fusion protein (multidrug efflux system)